MDGSFYPLSSFVMQGKDLFISILFLMLPQVSVGITKEDIKFQKSARVVIRKYCVSCHNAADQKAGINLDAFDFVSQIIRNGELFETVIHQSLSGAMPPRGKPRMNHAEMDSLVIGIRRILDEALSKPDPGEAIMRRLSHREYSYTIKDLVGVEFQAIHFFPSEGSGGEGFDNQSRVLFITPLMMERYYEAADSIVRMVKRDPVLWPKIFTKDYRPGIWKQGWMRLRGVFSSREVTWEKPVKIAKRILIPFATKAYRRILSASEQDQVMEFFKDVYFGHWKNHNAFSNAIEASLKRILISPHFLYRAEMNLPSSDPYPINNFELATRLSYFFWSSMPDESLLNTAYRENLQDPVIIRREALRMMEDAKFKRFSASFAPQWLGIEELLHSPQIDTEKFPEATTAFREFIHQEIIEYFHHLYTQEKNILHLLDSDYGMLNATLADHYNIPGVEGEAFRKVTWPDPNRGGILGSAAVLTATSLPVRTSPVLRGQWVLEEILGTPAAPPPPDVPALETAKSKVHSETDLRALLEQHRASPECRGCHQKMDPIGLGLENFDAIGRWRTHYTQPIMNTDEAAASIIPVPIDASGVLSDGTLFNGPQELKKYLIQEKEKFATTFSKKLLSYALGRSVEFLDSPTLKDLTKSLLETNFDSEALMLTLVQSYPFRHRRSDSALDYLSD